MLGEPLKFGVVISLSNSGVALFPIGPSGIVPELCKTSWPK